MSVRLCIIDSAYILFLKRDPVLAPKIFDQDDPRYRHTRKYIGALLSVGGFSYFAPLSSPKDSDYVFIDGKKTIRRSVVPIIRMTRANAAGEEELMGTIKLSNMIPVPDVAIIEYDIDREADEKYKDLVSNELMYIKKNYSRIAGNAATLYKQKARALALSMPAGTPRYVMDTIEFPLAERRCEEYQGT